MRQIKLEKAIKGLGAMPSLDPRIKAQVLGYAKENPFKTRGIPVMRFAIGFAALVLLAGSGTVLASQNAIPGETLYSVKRVSEKAYVRVLPNPTARVQANAMLLARRESEVERVFATDTASDKPIATDMDLALDAELADALLRESDAWVRAQENVFAETIDHE